MDDSFVFDCSLFQNNFPELAEGVYKQCSLIGIKGLNNYKIPYMYAQTFAKGRGKLYSYLDYFVININIPQKSEKELHTHQQKILEAAANCGTFYYFYRFLKLFKKYNELSDGWLNKVYYGMQEKGIVK